MLRKTLACIIAVLIAAITGWLSPEARGEEVILPTEIFFYSPVASVSGQAAVWINPAAMNPQGRGSLLIFTHRQDRLFRDWGTSATSKRLGIAWRQIKDGDQRDHQEYVFAFGGGTRNLNLGLSYRYMKEGAGYLHKRHLWTLGFLYQAKANARLGARAENLNRGRIDGKRSDIRYVYGVALRAYRDLVTASFDVDLTEKESHHQADFRTGIEVRPMPGMFLYADVDNHSRFNIGFRLNFGQSYVGHYANFDRDGKIYGATSYVGAVEGRQKSILDPGKKALVMDIDGELPENPVRPFFGRRPLRFSEYIDGLYRAADDEGIDRMVMNIGTLRCGLARAEELAKAVAYFRSRGKPAYAYLKTPNNIGYLLASAADSIIIPPVSELRLTGLVADVKMYKGLMEKLGVELEIERVDEYKTAPEPFLYEKPTEPNREQINRLLDMLYGEMTAAIAENRSLPRDSVRALVNSAPMMAPDAVAGGLIDRRMYYDEAKKTYWDRRPVWIPATISLRSYLNQPENDDRWGERPVIGLLIADGSIMAGKSGGHVGPYEFLEAVRKMRRDHRVKGILLRINSPGGDALASDLIWHEIEQTARVKPLVISMGNVAASGGYYIAAVKSPIFGDRMTITGSIGVFGGKVNFTQLYDKIGIHAELITRGANAGMYNSSVPFTAEQRSKLREELRAFYDYFVGKVGEARALSADSVNDVGRGQVWTGGEALANGLIDYIGGYRQALEELCRHLDVEPDRIDLVVLPVRYSLLSGLFSLPDGVRFLTDWLGSDRLLSAGLLPPEEGNIFFRLPYDLSIE